MELEEMIINMAARGYQLHCTKTSHEEFPYTAVFVEPGDEEPSPNISGYGETFLSAVQEAYLYRLEYMAGTTETY